MSSNAFESGERKVIPAVLIYVFCADKVLMIHRNASKGGTPDFHQGKWNGLGGKCERDESPWEASVREVQEESGITIQPENLRALGVIQFPNFKPHKSEDWTVFVFRADLALTDAEMKALEGREIPEGVLHWIQKHQLLDLNLWPGDSLFLPKVVSQEPFIGTIWYSDGRVARSYIGEI